MDINGEFIKDQRFERLKNEVRENPRRFIALVGSGLSKPSGIPDWASLRNKLVGYAITLENTHNEQERPAYRRKLERVKNESDLWKAFTILKNDILPLDSYEQIIKDNLSSSEKHIPDAYNLLWKLDVKGILTFNLDNFANQSYTRVKKAALLDTATSSEVERFGQFLSGTQNFVWQPHGIIQDPSTWVFTEEDYRDKITNNAKYLAAMASLWNTYSLIILGLNPTDFLFKYILEQSMLSGKGVKGFSAHHYLFSPQHDGSPEDIKRFGAMNISLIPYKPSDPITHPEIEYALEEIRRYIPEDKALGSVVAAEKPEAIPDENALKKIPVDDARGILSRHIATIIPKDKIPEKGQLVKLNNLYVEYLSLLMSLWIVRPNEIRGKLYNYKISDRIGGGAFGEVYHATNLNTGDIVAVKVLHSNFIDKPDYIYSFRRGVYSMSILTKEKVFGIVKIIEAFEVPASIVMEVVHGLNLKEALRYVKSSLSKKLEVLAKVGEIINNAHEKQVLHRDIKPDNIILRNLFCENDAENELEPVVLDFDLSWHQGAAELSVVHGMRVQGYAAPEQNVTKEQMLVNKAKGILTRHVSVDVFGYGMLAFFLFMERDPQQNEHQFAYYGDNLFKAVSLANSSDWKCLGYYLTRTITDCTKDNQKERISFKEALAAFKLAHQLVIDGQIDAAHPLVLLEIMARLVDMASVNITDFGRTVFYPRDTLGKEVQLRMSNKKKDTILNIEISKMKVGHDEKNISQAIRIAQEKIASIVKDSEFQSNVNVSEHAGMLIFTFKWKLPDKLTIRDIESLCEFLGKIKYVMVF